MLRKLDTLQRIEIAEGVEIQLHVAGPLPRGIAFALDVIVRGLIFGLVMLAESFLADLIFPEIFADPKVQGGMALLLWFVLEFGYFICFEASDRGATPGKRWLGLKVVRPSGVPVTWHQSVVRTMLRGVDLLPFCGLVGFIASLCNDRFQRLGDLAADTMVVYAEPGDSKDRLEAMDEVAPFRPPASLTREDQAAIVQYADRFGEWPAQRAEELAGYVQELTRVKGREGVTRLLGIAQWIRGAG